MPRFTRPVLALAGLTAVALAVTTVQAAAPAAADHHARPTTTLSDALRGGALPAAEQPYRPLTHALVPGNRYAMAGGCYSLRSTNGHFVTRGGPGFQASGAAAKAEPFHFQALDLGKYLL